MRKILIFPTFYFLFLSILILRFFYLVTLSEPQLATFIPDDSFYALQLAKNFSILGNWTFDGLNPATGFHRVYVYFLAFLYYLNFNLTFHQIFIISSIYSLLLISISLWITIRISNLISNDSGWFAILPFMSFNIICSSTFLLETSTIIFFYSMVYYSYFKLMKSDSTEIVNNNLVFFLSAAGPWIRTDFGLYVGMFAVIITTAHFFWNQIKLNIVKNIIISLIICIISTLLLLFHNYSISEEFIQSSASIKSYWSALNGHPLSSSISTVTSLLPLSRFISLKFYIPIISIIFFLLIFFHFKYLYRQHKFEKICLIKIVFFIYSILLVLGYIFVYSYNSSGLQIWYSATFLIPMSIIFSFLYPTIKKLKFFISITAISYVAIIPLSFQPIWPHQALMLEVARKELINLNGKIASWNSGIFGYFSNRSVINIDGLVNDNVVKPIKSKKLKKYIDDNNIRYIVDFEVMINVEKNKFRNFGLQNKDLIYFNEIFRDKTKVKWKSSDLLIWEIIQSK